MKKQFGWQLKGNRQWGSGLAEHLHDGHAYLSVVFSWQLQAAFERACYLTQQGLTVHAGGPAVRIQPEFLRPVADVSDVPFPALSRHNPHATVTSRGCIRRCRFCAVPLIEGDIRELSEWTPKPIICDNNLLACSAWHFERVIDALKGIRGVDFNQGLDARLLTPHHASRLAELQLHAVRLAWDHVADERAFFRAVGLLLAAGIPKRKVQAYVLIGFDDSPADALYRLRTVQGLGILPNPMRYQALTSTRRNEFVGAQWSHRELVRFMRYFSNLARTSKIPFEEFDDSAYRQPDQHHDQVELFYSGARLRCACD